LKDFQTFFRSKIMSIDDNDIYAAIGMSPPQTKEVKLLSDSQKESLLSPPSPWYRKKRLQLGIIILSVALLLWLINTIFSGGSSPVQSSTKLAAEREKFFQDELKRKDKELADSERSKINNPPSPASVVPITPVTKVSTSPKKPKTPPASAVVREPIVSRAQPQPVVQYVRTPPRTVYVRSPYQARSYQAPRVQPQSIASKPRLDPMEQWKQQSTMGSYGQGGTVSGSSSVVSQSLPSSGDAGISALQNGGWNSQSPSSSSEASAPQALTVSSSLGTVLPAGATALASFQQSISWASGASPTQPIMLILSSDFKDRTGKKLLKKGAMLTARISDTTPSCYFDLEVSEMNGSQVTAGAIVSTSVQGSYKRQGGAGFVQRLASGLLGAVGQRASRVNGDDGLLTSLGSSAAGSVLSAGQQGLNSGYSGNRPPTCLVSKGKNIELLVNQNVY
jgi:hypothetical protein